MQNYYANILEILNKKGISQRKFADMLGVSKSTINHWITGRYEPSMEMLKKTSDILEISIDQVIFQCDKYYWK